MNFGQTAQTLSRNPLGIIALFIVLIYGIAGLVFGLSSAHLENTQKWPLIWFLVFFPPLVFIGFVYLVVKHSLNLYAPSDFRADESFVHLNEKVSVIETRQNSDNEKISVIELRQNAQEIDPRGDAGSAFATLHALLETEQTDVAKGLAKAFLKVKRYEVSLKMFERIISHRSVKHPDSLNILQYRAYSLMGLGQYTEALQELQTLRSTGSSRLFDFWPRLALAYCYLKLQNNREYDSALSSAATHEQASEYHDMVGVLYPELTQHFVERLCSRSLGQNS